MFAARYFPGRYFARRHFPAGGSAGPPDVPPPPGGAFRRYAHDLVRAFRGYTTVADAIQTDTRVKDASEAVSFVFDFQRCPEWQDPGAALSAPEVDPVAGLTVGTPAVTAAARDNVPAGRGVAVRVSGGAAGTTYALECRATIAAADGASVRVVKGALRVE